MPGNMSGARKARRSSGRNSHGKPAKTVRSPEETRALSDFAGQLRQAALVGVSIRQAHLCAADRRRRKTHHCRRELERGGERRGGREDLQRRRRDRCRQADCRARAREGRTPGRVRSRRVSLSWAREGARRGCPVGRPRILGKGSSVARESRGREDRERDGEFVDKLVHINRVAKVVKGGRRFGFAALVVVGDQRGRVGFGHGKAREVPEAIRKATDAAKRNMFRIPLKDGRTLHHETTGRHGAGKVIVRPAVQGTGIIAGGPMRAVFESLGVGDVVAKSLGSSNPYNMVRATFHALKQQQSPRLIAQRRGKSVTEIIQRREGPGKDGSKDKAEAAGA